MPKSATRDVKEKAKGGWKQDTRRSLPTLVSELLNVPELEGRLWQKAEGENAPTPFIEQMIEIPNRFNNQVLHHNPAGLASYVKLGPDGYEFDEEPSDNWVVQAQVFAYVAFSLLAQLMIDRYDPDARRSLDLLDPLFISAFYELSLEQLAVARHGANRNHPCPCGSGLKSQEVPRLALMNERAPAAVSRAQRLRDEVVRTIDRIAGTADERRRTRFAPASREKPGESNDARVAIQPASSSDSSSSIHLRDFAAHPPHSRLERRRWRSLDLAAGTDACGHLHDRGADGGIGSRPSVGRQRQSPTLAAPLGGKHSCGRETSQGCSHANSAAPPRVC